MENKTGIEMEQLRLKVRDIENAVNDTRAEIHGTQKEMIELKAVVNSHIARNDERDERLSMAVASINKGLEAHMKEEMEYHKSRIAFETKIFDNFEKVHQVVHDMEEKVVGNGFKTKIMWSIMIAIMMGIAGIGFGVVQDLSVDKIQERYIDKE